MSKPLLTYFTLCFAPLLILASINYWNDIRSVDSVVGTEAQSNLNALTREVDLRLQEEEVELTRLALSQPLRDFLAHTERDAQNEAKAGYPGQTNSSLVIRNELLVSVASVLKGRGHVETLSLYAQNRRPLFQVERQDNRSDRGGLVFHQGDSAPDDLRQNFPLNESVGFDLKGSTLRYSVPVHMKESTPLTALLVGNVNLAEVISKAAAMLETGGQTSRDTIVVVLDGSTRILYHSDPTVRGQLVSNAMPAFLTVAQAMASNSSGLRHFEGPGGRDYLTAFSPLPRLNIGMAVARDRSALISSTRRWGVAGLLLAAIASLGGALLLDRYVQRRFRGIARVTEGLSAIAKGELDRRIELKSSDDARGLADNINVVSERLRAQIAREEESRQFESFVRLSAMLTHDLKNAIEALSLTVGNMERHFDNEQFRADALRSLTNATNKLKAIVARLTKPLTSLSGEHKRPQTVDLVPILRRVAAMTAEPLREKHTIEVNVPPVLFALVDATRIEEVMENLVLNALEAMADKSGKLTIEAWSSENGAPCFSVTDTGPGMSQSFITNRLFRPFSTTKKKGVGLGLYTCREVVRASGGSIEVQSVEGTGTTFRVMLPSPSNDKRN